MKQDDEHCVIRITVIMCLQILYYTFLQIKAAAADSYVVKLLTYNHMHLPFEGKKAPLVEFKMSYYLKVQSVLLLCMFY
jgi:hypothetical protein